MAHSAWMRISMTRSKTEIYHQAYKRAVALKERLWTALGMRFSPFIVPVSAYGEARIVWTEDAFSHASYLASRFWRKWHDAKD